jgi:predicted SAM-dependent methyltransferase
MVTPPASAVAPSGQRRLHIGGKVRKPGWEVLNVLPGEHVDHLGDARDLSRFADGAFTEIYASHVLEHFDFQGAVQAVLVEWHRILAPGGQLLISVPDLDILCSLFGEKRLDVHDRFLVMNMIFGGHLDQYDYHLVGLADDILSGYLANAGFVSKARVKNFGLFDDMSNIHVHGIPISLNVIAYKG